MFLNSLDLCASTSTVIAVTFRVIRRGSPDQQIIGKIADVTESLYLISVEATGFTTLLLSITRCISVSSPLYNIRKFYVAISATLFISYTTVREITFWLIWLTDENYYKQILPIHAAFVLGGIGLMVILVVLTNTISIMYIDESYNWKWMIVKFFQHKKSKLKFKWHSVFHGIHFAFFYLHHDPL